MALNANEIQRRLCVIAFLISFVKQAQAQAPSTAPDYFAPLGDLNTPSSHAVSSQNFTRCCLRALDEWRKNDKTTEIIVESSKNPSKIFSNADELRNAKPEEQFPCGAEYDNDMDGATRVKISYAWCKSNCGGWQRSRSAVLEQWVQPFVGFVLPAAVFCLNVPRKMVIDIPDDVFGNVWEDLKKNWKTFTDKAKTASIPGVFQAFAEFIGSSIVVGIMLLIKAVGAAALGLTNVVVWVLVVFSAAAPMILSGLYEAAIDRQVLRAIEKDILGYHEDTKQGKEDKVEVGQNEKGDLNNKSDEQSLVNQNRNHNQDDHLEGDEIHHIEQDEDGNKDGDSKVNNNPSQVKYQIHLLYAVLVGNLKLQTVTEEIHPTDHEHMDDRDPGAMPPAKQNTYLDVKVDRAWHDVKVMIKDLDPIRNAKKYKREKFKTETRLKTMLACQASFGASVGAPVAFFLGSFLFSVFGNHSKLGDSDVSLSLAFGEWWMTIPHVAIVSGCLLAGNNPNTLEAIVAGIEGVTLPKHKTDRRLWTSFYKSIYQPVWMWERGRNKRNWIKAVQNLVGSGEGKEYAPGRSYKEPDDKDPKDNWRIKHWKRWKRYVTTTKLKDIPKVEGFGWTLLILTASVLVVIPFVLAYVTSFYTPTIGLSCRTFTFVLYFVFQSLLTILWCYDFSAPKRHPFRRPGTHQPTIFFGLTFLFFIGSSFTAIIGTFMQILGVYRNCLCDLPMGYWGSRDFHFTVSSNSAEGIYYARLYWLSTAIASICLLVIFCYFGWWYQRHWRVRFNSVVEQVLDVKIPRAPKVKDPPKPNATKRKALPTKKDVPADSSKTKEQDKTKEQSKDKPKRKTEAEQAKGGEAVQSIVKLDIEDPVAKENRAATEPKKELQQPLQVSRPTTPTPSLSHAVGRDGEAT